MIIRRLSERVRGDAKIIRILDPLIGIVVHMEYIM